MRPEASRSGTRSFGSDHTPSTVEEPFGVRRAIGVGLLTIDEAAEQLNVTPRFVWRRVAERRISYLKVIRLHPTDVDHWLQVHRVDACQPAVPAREIGRIIG